jgi:hypothetical protein
VVNDLLTRVKDIYQRLRSKLSALLSTPVPPQPSEKAKPKASSSSRSPRVYLKKRGPTAKGVNKRG